MVVDAKDQGILGRVRTEQRLAAGQPNNRSRSQHGLAHAPWPHLIIVTAGTITEYDADCNRHVYTFVSGQPAPTLVDPGHGRVHIIRNEGSIQASTVAVQLVPHDPTKPNRR
jgi:hypothetical protein